MKSSPKTPQQIVNILSLGLMFSLFGDTAIYVVLPTHTLDAGILLIDVGLMLSANRIIRIFINGPYGYMIERWPRRRVLIGSQLLGAVANLLYVFTGFWPLLIGRLLWGIAWAGIWIGGNTAVLDVADHTNRGRLVGRFHMLGFAGFAGGALAGGLLTDLFSYQVTFLVFSGVSLGATLLWALFLPETRTSSQPDAGAPPPPAGYVPPRVYTYREKAAPLITAIIIMTLNWLIFLGVTGAVLSLLLQERVGATLSLGAVLLPIASLTGIIAAGKDTLSFLAAPLSGRLSDWLGNRWTLIIAALILGFFALLLTAVGQGIMVVVGILMGAVTTSILQTQVTALAGDYSRANQQGRILGIFNTVGDMGSAGGPLLAFALINPDGLNWSFTMLFGLAAGLMLLVLPGVIIVAWRDQRSESLLKNPA